MPGGQRRNAASPLAGGDLDEAGFQLACGAGEAFLLAFAPGAPYDSVNYRWFDARYADFLYVDRIVVAEDARGLGLASRLYRDLFRHARAQGYGRVVCEFDVDPPNPASERFHRGFGFAEVGSQRLPGGKTVSLQSAPVPTTG